MFEAILLVSIFYCVVSCILKERIIFISVSPKDNTTFPITRMAL